MTPSAAVKFLLLGFLGITLSAAQSPAIQYPTTVEVDLVFPRNDTFSPSTLLPVVFAVQNARAFSQLDLRIWWGVWKREGEKLTQGYEKFTYVDNNGTDDIQFVEAGANLNQYNVTEGVFQLSYTLTFQICSDLAGAVKQKRVSTLHMVEFTIKNGAPPPSIVTGSSDVCPKPVKTFKVDRLVRNNTIISSPCFDIDGELPSPTPCAIRLDEAAASSISTAITSKACTSDIYDPPVLTTGCPALATTSSEPNGACGSRSKIAGMGIVLTAIAAVTLAAS